MSEGTAEREILRWAAGGARGPHVPRMDEQLVLGLLWRHQLYTRFQERVQREQPPWCSRQLKIGAWAQCRAAQQQLQLQLQALREILKAWPAEGGPLVIVKGLTTYALTGDPGHVRFSSDIDVLCGDIPGLCRSLEALGYDMSSTWAAHHSVRCVRGPLLIEPHNYFPMQAYPPEIQIGPARAGASGAAFTAADFAPEDHPGHWRQPILFSRYREVLHAELSAHLVPALNPEVNRFFPGGPLRVLHPNMAVLIVCQNIFKDFISSALYGEPWMRLGDLADIGDLVRHPLFEADEFLHLSEQYACEDALALVGSLCEQHLGRDPLPAASGLSGAAWPGPAIGPRLPRRLSYWDFCWATQGATAEASLVPPDSGSVIEDLGTNEVLAGRGTVVHSYVARASGEELAPGEEAIPRVILNLNPDGEWTGTIRFSVACETDALRVRVWLSRPADARHEQTVSLYLGLPGGDHLWMNTGPQRDGFETQHVSVSSDAAGFTFDAVYPWDVLPVMARNSPSIPALLQVMTFQRQAGLPDEAVFPTITLPLQIVSDAAGAPAPPILGEPDRPLAPNSGGI